MIPASLAITPSAYVAPVGNSTLIFRDDIFKGKVLFHTGGGSGICRAMTEAVMRHGANAAIVGRKLDRLTQAAKELSEATSQVCIPTQADVRQSKALQEAVSKTIEKFGRIDFVICENAFRTVMEIDTIGTYNTIKATLAHVHASKGSYIMTSATLHYDGTPYQAHVSAAKASVDALSNILVVEEGPHGVRSNVISPCPIANTEGAARLAPMAGKDSPYPLGRLGDIRDVSNATIFLFGDAASFITGQILAVDGGSEHLRTTQLPYPASVFDPSATLKVLKARM
ncbi:2,4-dienoyl-CoA reductase [Guyanagaster necrorhizus]|uniref:2,4-dienoyl-CoA reductase [(3E)-enoyl-CoA-producing] n=1 Tax=Guyanagaster necrorhizus TaxID=856835 RepID=A0A9P7VG82_9AGAR|nr:2,4-dienoyl-CoA reductase [Guyanagaster necrorhizus MCA 3950]KAG7439424.1 2,4-dienoyl-CoA reductase [Guyanagaster necrorhizus MCA 3950]